MRARVRIAPVERWCDEQLRAAKDCGADPADIVGKVVSIHTERMIKDSACGAKDWPLEHVSAQKLGAEIGQQDGIERWACEHVLELD